MPRRTSTGELQLNFTLSEPACKIIQRFAPTRKSYGRFLSTVLEEYEKEQSRDEFRERLSRLEDKVEALAQR